uniref:Protein transport protein sec16 n=1 Tax=Anolis carolinensis TaxID=28377 RepID=A0A803SKK4_ANOCA
MQPPPQTVPPGAGGPPPLAAAQNMYWRNSGPLGRRANAPTTAAAGPMRPVTDPFAFGAMQSLRGNPPLGNTAKGDPPAMQSFSPVAFPPPHLPAGDNSHGLNPSLPASVSQSGAHGTFSSQPTSSLYSERVTSSADMHPSVERGARNPMDPVGFPLENSLRGQHVSLPPSGQEMSRNPNIPTSVPSSTSFLPSAQQTVPQWMAPQSNFQPQGGPPYSVYPEPPSQNAFYAVTQSPLGVSQPHQSTPQQAPAVQNAVQAPLMFGDAPSANAPHNSAWQNAGGASPWSAQIPQEHFYLQPLNTASTPPVHQATQENGRPAQAQAAAEGVTKRDPGTVSMFFKGDEAENEEILSLEKNNEAGKADVDAFQQTMGHTYYQPLHPVHQVPIPPFSNAVLPPETLPDVQNSFKTSNEAPAFENAADKADPVDAVENQECIQNQEVLPSEPLTQSCASPGADPNRYASLVGPSLPKNAAASHLEGGPNLEAPDLLLRPGRPDSVSSNYSNLSHRSVSNSSRPQELGTFIQQESGKPEEEASRGFFKQMDSSPLGGEASEAGPGKNYYGGLSLAPTPSPPKPTGVFQMSANSSFEPVRSHASGIKHLETSQAKMPAERNSAKKSPATPVASPGNLEQPPDNLETLFLPQTHPLPLTVTGNVGESAPEKRPSSNRAPGGVKKCESPATTLWAHNELPSFGGNVLLAPAAPAVYVPAKQSVQVVQPPEEGVSEQQHSEPGSVVLPPLQPGSVSSENLENPPKMGEEEALRSQMSSGYASLLSSPPTEALQNPPVLLAQPNQSYSLAQPVNFSLNRHENNHLGKDPALGSRNSGQLSGENISFPGSSVHPPTAPLPHNFSQHASETTVKTLANVQIQPAAQGPLNLAPENHKALPTSEGGPAPQCTNAGSMGAAGRPANGASSQELSQALDFTVTKALEQNPSNARGAPEAQDQQRFYQQVTRDTHGEAAPSQVSLASQAATAPQPVLTLNPQPTPGNNPVQMPASYSQTMDAYGRSDPLSYQYDTTAAYGDARGYRYTEPERPSSRASQTSERPTSSIKNDPSLVFSDPSRSDRYPSSYDPRYRDPRAYDHRYWYDPEHSPYQKRETYPHDRYEDHWRYDPRFAGSFDEDLEPRRDPYGDDFDRRSVHSEHSGHSLHSSHSIHSRHSSFSSRSQQSQLYRSNHDLTAGAYEADHQPASLHTEYSCGAYPPYINPPSLADYNHSAQAAWPTVEQVPSRPLTPEKFSVPHICARFGPGGYLIKALPNLPSEGQPALVEIHSMEMMMQHLPEQEEMRAFPGPLTKDDTHKVDVINFAQNKATRCSQDELLLDKESACLLWDFVVLLCRQNGTVVGTDIAELLLRDHKTVWLPGKSPNEANLIDFTNEALDHAEEESGEAQLSFLTDSLIATIDSLEKETERFRELLLYGRKKDALESAMKHGLWGHALLLASKMDSRTHARVMTRFANSLPINDPLQTVYQLMSGRMPAASTCCGDEKWGDWRPHLAMVLSNLTNNMDVETRTIITMGDTLVSKGLLEAAHFCYLMAQVGFGVYTKKTTKLVLIGSNHSLPFRRFATNEAIQRTEAYEYAQSLGTQPCCLPNFQVFKFIYACRLAELGLAAQAFHYCEVISKAILKSPSYYSPVLISQVIQMSSRLRLFDPQMKEKPEQELFLEPDWLVQLRSLDGQIKVSGTALMDAGRATPQQYACSTPSSEVDHVSQNEGTGAPQEVNPGPENPLLASLLPSSIQPTPGVQLMPSGGFFQHENGGLTYMPCFPKIPGATWFGWLMGKGKNEAHLPDDKNKSIVWDEKKQRWVNLDEPEEEVRGPTHSGFNWHPFSSVISIWSVWLLIIIIIGYPSVPGLFEKGILLYILEYKPSFSALFFRTKKAPLGLYSGEGPGWLIFGSAYTQEYMVH